MSKIFTALNRSDMVIIEWEDSHSPDCGVWIAEDEVNMDNLTLTSVGFVLKKTDKSITIAAHIHDGDNDVCDQVAGVMTIPKSAIVSISKLEIKP